eukprot:gene52972-35577_t
MRLPAAALLFVSLLLLPARGARALQWEYIEAPGGSGCCAGGSEGLRDKAECARAAAHIGLSAYGAVREVGGGPGCRSQPPQCYVDHAARAVWWNACVDSTAGWSGYAGLCSPGFCGRPCADCAVTNMMLPCAGDCRWFLQCQAPGVPALMACTPPLVFDASSNTCNY